MAINIYLCITIQNKLLTIDLLFHFMFIHSFVYFFVTVSLLTSVVFGGKK